MKRKLRLNKKKDEEKKAMQQLQQHLKNKLDEEEINDYKKLLADEAYQTWLQLKVLSIFQYLLTLMF